MRLRGTSVSFWTYPAKCFQNGSSRPVELGQRLPTGAVLHFPADHKSIDYVEIALRNGMTRLTPTFSERQC